ncbi:iron reductase [Dichomitus squalens LYAD-421 SS1]|uniref:ferric-chelate reductase (NADPH) n=2 Tax=Dichomitus squalens TaxID=114155 RepID=R7T0X4_DICSQ|nr:iron reductase [Dichomitus squalens LYAD-421 SS1]EJF61615.1 iron reductase [Dichomitus squalens LYAD-421 SS1]
MQWKPTSSLDRQYSPEPPPAIVRRAGPQDLDASVVFWADIVIICVAGAFFLFTLPRAVARFGPGGGWLDGHFFRGITPSSAVSEKAVQVRNPLHMRAWQARFPGAMRILRYPMIGRIHTGGVAICALYFGLLLFAALYKSSIFKDPQRAGLVAASQIPIVYVLATKNNVLSVAWGTAYDKLNYLHRFAGRLLVLAANVHAIGYIYLWTRERRWLRTIAQPQYAWGLTALILLDILLLFSLAWFRQKFYNMFIFTHVIASIVFLVAVSLHMSQAVPYVIAGAVFYGVDRIVRLLKTRIATATVTTLPEICMTELTIPSINGGWRAGQHVRVHILSMGMGFYGWLESHPYTIASAPTVAHGAPEGLVLLSKNCGRWTKALHAIAAANTKGVESGSHVKVLIQGPYGGPGYTLPHSLSGAMYVVGGSGISYGLAGVQEVLQYARAGSNTVRIIELVWSVHHPDCLTPLLPTFSSMLAQALALDIKLTISVFYTRAVTSDHEFKEYALSPGLALEPGRPPVNHLVHDVVGRTLHAISDRGERRGVFVGACGPGSLGDAVRNAVSDLDVKGQSNLVGGVELHEEIFSL